MGQQQLLIVILVTIIVGIATVVAINIFGTAADQANRDEVRQQLLSALGNAKALYTSPEVLGGAGKDFRNITDINRLNIPKGSDYTQISVAVGTYSMTNDSGTFIMIPAEQHKITLIALPKSGPPNIQVDLERDLTNGGWLPPVWSEPVTA